MERSKLNIKYVTGKPVKYQIDFSEPMPSTRAIAWCMSETEVSRLFSKDDVWEFLFRLPILFHLRELVEDWLLGGTLFSYEFRGRQYTLKVEDLAMHFGLEAYDHYLNVTPRDRYIRRVQWGKDFPSEVGHHSHFPQLRMDGTRLVVDQLIYGPDVTPELISKAEFFARDVMKFIPESSLINKTKHFRYKNTELKKRAAMIEALNHFDLGRLPAATLSDCMEKVWTGGPKDKIMEAPSDADNICRQLRPMIFIAWTWANHFTNEDGLYLAGKDIFTRDYLDYEAEDGGYNLTFNIEMAMLEELIPVLRGVSFPGDVTGQVSLFKEIIIS